MSEAAGITLPEADRVLASLPQAVVLLEPGLRIASVNPAAEQFFGQSLRRLVGVGLRELVDVTSPRVLDRLDDYETPVSARELAVQVKGAGLPHVHPPGAGGRYPRPTEGAAGSCGRPGPPKCPRCLLSALVAGMGGRG